MSIGFKAIHDSTGLLHMQSHKDLAIGELPGHSVYKDLLDQDILSTRTSWIRPPFSHLLELPGSKGLHWIFSGVQSKDVTGRKIEDVGDAVTKPSSDLLSFTYVSNNVGCLLICINFMTTFSFPVNCVNLRTICHL